MSTSYIAVFPANPLLPVPDKELVIRKLKEKNILAAEDFEWKDPETNDVQVFYRAGTNYADYFETDMDDATRDKWIPKEVIDFRQHENIQPEFYTFGKFELYNPVTGTDLSADWAEVLSEFLGDNTSRWTDPADGKPYFIFELESRNIGLGKYFLTFEEGIGNPNTALFDLLEEITGQRHKWIRTII